MKKLTLFFSLVITLLFLALLLPLSLLSAAKAAADTSVPFPARSTLAPSAIPLNTASPNPDGFGYTYQDELELNGPVFNFIDISGTGTELGFQGDPNQDDKNVTITLPFNFNYYGVSASQFLVGNNGALIFNPSPLDKVGPNNACLTSTTSVNLIAPWWDDWGNVGAVYLQTFGATPNRYTVVQWNGMTHFPDTTGVNPVTFEVILYETSNVILFQYLDTNTAAPNSQGQGGSVGIIGSSTANAQSYSCNIPSLADSRAIRFQKSSLTIVKDTSNPDTSSQVFTFTGSSGLSSTFTLADDGTPGNDTRSFNLSPGNSYTATENTPPPLWGLSALSCQSSLAAVAGFTGTVSSFNTNESTRVANITSLAPGDSVTCTFVNSQLGRIVIQKVTNPASDPEVFTFTNTITTDFTLNTNPGPASRTFNNLNPGSYSFLEQPLSGWDLTGLTCNDPSGDSTGDPVAGKATIEVAAGETVTCIFTNTKRSSIVIEKVAIPTDDPQDFAFTSNIPDNFSLDDDSTDGTLLDQRTYVGLVSGVYTVTETAVNGWDLTSLLCTDPSGGSSGNIINGTATINAAPGETVTCVFTNTKRGVINIIKDSQPNHPQDFNFTTTVPATPTFTLDDDPASPTPPVSQTLSVASGIYTFTEGVVTNWTVTAINCVDPSANSTVNTGTRSAVVDLGPGETVSCTFINKAADSTLIVDKTTTPVSDPQVFTFTSSIPAAPTFTLDTDGVSPTPISRTFVISTGIYSVNENILPDWDLTGTTCSDGSPISSIDLAPGETVTCTFANTKRGTVIINKVTSPGSDPQDFAFTSTIPGNPSFSLDTDGGDITLPSNQTFFVEAGGYTVGEEPVISWDLADLTCVDPTNNSTIDLNTATATLNVASGETVNCTFTNTKRGSITIIKDAAPDNAQDFGFTSNIPGNASFFLDDDPGDGTLPNSQTFSDLTAGAYNVTESLPVTNWSLTSITCTDPTNNSSGNIGTGLATINVAPGEDVSCTFTNSAAPGTINIRKVAVANPANDPQDFSFTATGPTAIAPFSLDDDADGTLPANRSFGALTPGTYTLTEGVLSDWDVSGLACDDTDSTGNSGTGAATIILSPAETVTCTFTNTKRGAIVINKVTNPVSDPQDFPFTSTITGSATFALDTDSSDGALPNSRTFLTPPGNYSVVESAVTGWNVTGLTCTDNVGGGSTGNLGTRTAAINLSAGETVTCTFTNTIQPGSITITKNAIPNDPQDFGYLLAGASTNLTFALDDDSDGTLSNTRTFTGLTRGVYNIVEGATANWALTGLTCNDPSGGTITNPSVGLASIDLGPGENVSCLYTNTFNNTIGSITIIKTAVPTSTQVFAFSGSLGTFSLVDDGTPPNSQTFLNLNPGSYTVTEGTVSGWDLADLICTDPDNGSVINVGARTATIDLDAAENVICTFTNNFVGTSDIVYLPILVKGSVSAPDLTITNFSVTGSNPNQVVTIVVQNLGNLSTAEGFWVDFYVNPTTLPNNPALGGNRRWERTGSSQGIAWPVPILGPGASVTLTSNGAPGTIGPAPAPLSTWTGSLPSGTNQLYGFVDSFDAENAPFGEVDESNESNNMASQTVVASTGTELVPNALPDLNNLPPRWQPK